MLRARWLAPVIIECRPLWPLIFFFFAPPCRDDRTGNSETS